jgi:hypothetical protein
MMNLRAPSGASLNDAIDKLAHEKIKISTSKDFWYSVTSARMWKWDLVNAYKNVPASLDELCLQAFSWLGMWKHKRSLETHPRSPLSIVWQTPSHLWPLPIAAYPPNRSTAH